MNAFNPKRSARLKTIGIVVYALLLLALLLIVNRAKVNGFLASVFSLFRSIIWGLVLCYLLNPMFRFYERKTLYRVRPMGLRRTIALILSYLSFLLIIAFVLALLIPQLYLSASDFLANFDNYLQSAVTQFNNAVGWINGKLGALGLTQSPLNPLNPESAKNFSLNYLLLNIPQIMSWAAQFFGTEGSLSIIDIFGTVADVITDLIFAFFVSRW